ncbi:MAG: hypothetical protein PUE95_03275 [Lachnospiraceae bacterium]|nr:hypothetical protein [Lachnospiraceae bacterium]MDD6810647.1 hypothetical protein [Lachnospiraceae bacterium]
MKKQIEGQLNLFDYDFNIKVDKNIKHESGNPISLYKECVDCWCRDCKHNEKLDAVPRDFAGVEKPCPACSFCEKEEHAETCEINSYENGCKLRAAEEGIIEF